MRTIRIKSISLRNFRGVQQFELHDVPNVLNIYGRNGSGKTSIYDAWLWLLFGKDHLGRTDHELKPKGTSRVNVEVDATLLVDEKPITLKRVYREEWVKPRTEKVEVFKGNTTDYSINDVGVKKSEYDSVVAKICSESVFKTITNPHYFTSLDKEQQRTILFSLIPEITDEQIGQKDARFAELLKNVTGVSFENFKKELASRRNKITEQLKRIPIEIETTHKSMPVAEDWEELEAQIQLTQEEIDKIDRELTDIAAKSEDENKRLIQIQDRINELEDANARLRRSEEQQIRDDIERKKREVSTLRLAIADEERDYKQKKSCKEYLDEQLAFYNNKIAELYAAWKSIRAEELTFDENELICPTCKQSLPEYDIEEKRAKMIESFNKSKAERLKVNIEEGKKIRQLIDGYTEEINRINLPDKPDTSEKSAQIEILNAEIAALEKKEPKYTDSIIYKANMAKIAELRASMIEPAEEATIQDKKERKALLMANIDALKKRLYNRDIIENLQKQIDEINDRKISLNQALSDIEEQEFTIKEFESAKNTEYESRINMLFSRVRFRLFREQVNGQVVPDCEATMDGTNYSTLSSAEKIYAGLDIINGVSSHYGITAPIFIDNRESTTLIPEMQSQIINLYVDATCKQLTIK